MAEMEDSELSLMSLEEELTCCICLSLFDCPVTIPCGHNFCQDCLLSTWKDSYSCPQCRTHFSTKPELKKNTVLSTVVQTFNQRKCKSEASLEVEEPKAEKQHVIRCDTCMEAEAAQTCLTCMASFCEEHLRPHRDNPRFSVHQLSAPVGDLSERICPDHHKLMELFCSQHGRPICSLCLQQGHKGCSFMSPEEQRTLKESDLRGKLSLLDKQITKNEDVIFQANGLEKKLKDSATNKKASLAAHYQQMRDMLAREERDALNAVDCELESGETKLKNFSKKLAGNITSMSKAKEYIQTLLSQTQSLAFLQASVNLPQAATFDPFCPRMNLDSKKVKTSQEFAAVLKAHLTKILTQPVENRLPLLKVEKAAPDSASSGSTGSQPEPEVTKPPKQKKAPNNPPNPPPYRPVPVPGYQSATGWKPLHPPGYMGPQFGGPPMRPGPGPQPKIAPKKKPQKQKPPHATEDNMGKKNLGRSMENLMEFGGKDKPKGCNPESKEKPKGCNPESKEASESVDIPPDITTAEKRTELLKYATVLTMDPKTAHKRITLSDSLTKATVSDEHTNYPDCPERFAICSQVLASKGFSRGRHYWEVRLSSNNFIGVGLAYSSIDRKGPMSRLGRNAQSWCIEWFNVKLSAWHNSNETVLVNPNPKRVGVLLDCEEGTATFYNVADRAYPFHTFVFPFAEAVYPAFWIFSNGLSVSLCKLT